MLQMFTNPQNKKPQNYLDYHQLIRQLARIGAIELTKEELKEKEQNDSFRKKQVYYMQEEVDQFVHLLIPTPTKVIKTQLIPQHAATLLGLRICLDELWKKRNQHLFGSLFENLMQQNNYNLFKEIHSIYGKNEQIQQNKTSR